VKFNEAELELIVEALRKAARRHESEARFDPKSRTHKVHLQTAINMNVLADRIEKVAEAA